MPDGRTTVTLSPTTTRILTTNLGHQDQRVHRRDLERRGLRVESIAAAQFDTTGSHGGHPARPRPTNCTIPGVRLINGRGKVSFH